MNRLLSGFLAFVVALLIGYIAVPEVKTDFVIQTRPQIEERFTQLNANLAPIVPSSKEQYFVPEFRDLPNFEEVNAMESEGKLIEIVGDGIYRRSDVVAKARETWLVLFEHNGKYSLRESTATVKNLETTSWPGDELDARLRFNGIGKPVIAVKNIRGLKPGKVVTLSHTSIWTDNPENESRESQMDDDFRREFKINENSYVLRVSRGLTRDGTQVAVLVLESNGVTQVITQTYHEPSNERDIVGSLLWAGDLDGDGELDLYFDEFNEKGFTATELHLSSLAGSGQLVHLAGTFGMAGC